MYTKGLFLWVANKCSLNCGTIIIVTSYCKILLIRRIVGKGFKWLFTWSFLLGKIRETFSAHFTFTALYYIFLSFSNCLHINFLSNCNVLKDMIQIVPKCIFSTKDNTDILGATWLVFQCINKWINPKPVRKYTQYAKKLDQIFSSAP